LADTGFKLKNIADINRGMFASTDPLTRPKGDPIYNIMLEKLSPFKSHPFKLYTGQRFEDMVESIKANGVIIPIIIRPIDEFNYEILSGHNRVEASRAAGLEAIPCIIRDGLTDDDAMLIVTESNLIQRSFSDMTYYERSVVLTMHHNATKHQGKRTDLIQDIENMLKASDNDVSEASGAMRQKLDSRGQTGDRYDLSSRVVAYYLRIHDLNKSLVDRLENGEIAFRTAVTLTYLSEDEQRVVDDVLDSSHYKLDMKKADSLRTASKRKPLDHETVEQILAGKKKPKSSSLAQFKLKPKILSRYFGSDAKHDEIEALIIKGLDLVFATMSRKGDLKTGTDEENTEDGYNVDAEMSETV